jgi:hypothetical protein
MLCPLFPVDAVREDSALRPPPPDEARHGHMWPIAVLFTYFEQRPVAAVELAFHPAGGLPEGLTEESWGRCRSELGLAPFAGASSLLAAPDGDWHVEFGPHMLVTDSSGSARLVLPRPSAAWEESVQASGSCVVALGTGLTHDDETSAVAIPPTAAALSAAHAGSCSVQELSEVPGLHVVPLSSFRPYNPLGPVTFVLDTDVLIEMQKLCFEPARLRPERAEAVRDILVNLAGREVLPGPALAQLYQPSRIRIDARAALEAWAAFDHLASLSRAEIMDERREPASLDAAYERDVASMGATPQMLMKYAGVLRMRQLWHPSQTLEERARSFEALMQWLRSDLRVNAALLVQVAFNLWMSDDDAKRQASRLLHFRAAGATGTTLQELWGTAYDLFLVEGHADAAQMAGAIETVILTFDRGLAGMRDFFEHVELGDLARIEGLEPGYGWNARLRMGFHPRLEHMRPRVAELAAGLHADMLARLAQRGTRAYPRSDLLAIVEAEERRLLGG